MIFHVLSFCRVAPDWEASRVLYRPSTQILNHIDRSTRIQTRVVPVAPHSWGMPVAGAYTVLSGPQIQVRNFGNGLPFRRGAILW